MLGFAQTSNGGVVSCQCGMGLASCIVWSGGNRKWSSLPMCLGHGDVGPLLALASGFS